MTKEQFIDKWENGYDSLGEDLDAVIEAELAKAQEKSDEDMIEFGQWVSHNDWVYLPSKKYWVNEEQEEMEQKLSSQEILQLFKQQKQQL